ncbi:MAG: YtxH domain-containing protein [Polyangiales bacterium]
MSTVDDTIHQGAVRAERYAKEVAAGAEDAGFEVVDYVGKLAKVFFQSIGLDSRAPIRLLDRLGLEPRGYGRAAGAGGFAIGVLLGAGAALLFAPMSGRELRKRIREQVLALIDATDEKIEAKATEIAGEVVIGAENVVDSVGSRIEPISPGDAPPIETRARVGNAATSRGDEPHNGKGRQPDGRTGSTSRSRT